MSDPHAEGGPAIAGDVSSFPHDAEYARTLVAAQRRGHLATLTADGFPFGSVVSYVDDASGRPVVCISAMAEHTINAKRDPRASLLVATDVPDGDDPLAAARVTLVGTLVPFESVERLLRDQYLAAHPGAGFYVDFPDFSWWRLEPSAVRYVGGFGHMSWVGADDYANSRPDPIAPSETAIRTHLDEDHADVLVDYAKAYAGLADATSARTAGVDRYGVTLWVTTPSGGRTARIAFDEPATTVDDVRAATVTLARRARLRSPG
jgi:putative heme iron utilization protein